MSLTAIVPLIQSALDVIAAFQGDAQAASKDRKFSDAVEVINAVAPLLDSFSRGIDVTPEDVKDALVGMDDALAKFDEEIARQQQGGG